MNYLAGAALALGIVTILEGYVILGRAQILLDRIEQIRGILTRSATTQPEPPTSRWERLNDWLSKMPEQDSDVATVRPLPEPRTDTVESTAVITPQAVTAEPSAEEWARVELAKIVARLDDKPAPRKRTGSTRKAATADPGASGRGRGASASPAARPAPPPTPGPS